MPERPLARPRPSRYTGLARLLHWVLAALIIVQVVLADRAHSADEAGRVAERLILLANHKSIGLTVLALVLLRLIWRLTHAAPALPDRLPRWQRLASQVSHASLYVLMLGLPLSGLMMALSSAYGASWFGLFEVPRIMAANDELTALSKQAHSAMGYALAAIVFVHVSAALHHHFIIKDSVLTRMSSAPLTVVFVGVLTGSLMLATPEAPTDPQLAVATAPVAQGAESESPQQLGDVWDIDYERSFIRFTAQQGGAAFTGEWSSWQARIAFDPQTPAVEIDVRVDVTQPDTGDDQRDSTLLDREWFDAREHPTAQFRLSGVLTTDGDSLLGAGELIIKQRRTPVDFRFQVDTREDRRRLTGAATLDRLALEVGTGDWTDTSTVGQFVEVSVQVIAKRTP